MSDEESEFVQDTRMELNDLEGDLPENLIEYHIRKAKADVEEIADSGAVGTEQYKTAIVVSAALRLVSRDKDTFLESKGGADFDKSWDISEFIARLEAEKEDALEEISPSDFVFKAF